MKRIEMTSPTVGMNTMTLNRRLKGSCSPEEGAAGVLARKCVPEGNKHAEWKAKYNILIVDDNRDFLIYMTRLLKANGYFKVAAENGKDALAELNGNSCFYDIALVDYNMPGMTGTEVLHKIRTISPETTMVMFVSGETTIENRKEAYKNGCINCITKPIVPKKLLDYLSSLKKYMDKKREEHNKRLKNASKPFPFGIARKTSRAAKMLISERGKSILKTGAVYMAFLIFSVVAVFGTMELSSFLSSKMAEVDNSVKSIVGYLERDEQREIQALDNHGFKIGG